MPKPSPKPTSKAKQERQLGRMLVNVYESGYLDRGTAYRITFFKGVLAGFGGVIGATIVVALLLWVLTFFSEVPLIGDFSKKVTYTLQQAK